MKQALLFILFLAASPCLSAAEQSLTYSRFGEVTLYYATAHPSHVVLFVSGDGGWNRGVVDMARELVSLDALVVGVNINRFLKEMESSREACSYPAADFEELSKFVQQRLGFPVYRTPILVGYSSGATLVYATLVQAPPDTFLGAISLGFCPDLLLAKPMCHGSGLEWTAGPKGKGYNFLPARSLEVPWIALQGTIDQVCDPKATGSFVEQVPQGKVMILPKVGHGFSVPANWMPQFKDAFLDLVASGRKQEELTKPKPSVISEAVSDLPLVEVPATGGASNLMGVIVTGDGGWGVTDRGIAQGLAARGIPVVGLNSLKYFWSVKTPEQAAADLERIIRHYSMLWNRNKVVAIGYSFGADVLPLMLNLMPNEVRSETGLIALLGPSSTADFQFHWIDWFGHPKRSTSRPVLPELEKLKGKKILCFYGTKDDDALCRELDPNLATVTAIQSGHRFGKDYQPIVDAILREAR